MASVQPPVLRPQSAADVSGIVAEAAAAGTTLEVIGSGTRRGIGRPVAADAVLTLDQLRGIVDYDPGELVLTAGAGTPVAEIAAAVAAAGQHLAFEPPDLAPLWGGAPGAGTIGGLLGVGWGGPARPFAGAPRDHFLGFAAVNGRGEAFVAGGKVIKNVTGYDLPKLLAGSFGTLAVLTEVTIKTLPAPRTTATVAIDGLDDVAAVAAMTAVLARGGVTAAVHLPGSSTVFRVTGDRESAAERTAQIIAQLGAFGSARISDDDPWRAIGSFAPFVSDDAALWRVVLPATAAVAFVARCAGALNHWFDWGGALVWLAMPAIGDAGAAVVRGALASDGHATLVRATDAIRADVCPFHPLAAPLAALEERVRERFDPDAVLNPGRRVRP